MEGLIINLLKDVQQKSDSIDLNKDARQQFQHLLWANYDRIEIKSVNSMADYFILKSVRNKWIGSIQSLHLYTDNTSSSMSFSNNPSGILIGIDREEAPCFFCVASFKLNYDVKQYVEWGNESGFEKFNRGLRKYVSDFISEYCQKENITFNLYNSLGAEDLVIIMVSDSIKSFASVVESMRKLECDTIGSSKSNTERNTGLLFETSYSFVGQNNINRIKEPGLDALVSITMQNDKDVDDYIKMALARGLNVAPVKFSFGEYDVRLRIDSSEALIKQYLKDGLFSANNPLYTDFIHQSQTTWLYDQEKLEAIKRPEKIMCIAAKDYKKLVDSTAVKLHFEKDIQEFETILNDEAISRIPHFKEECLILLSEYKRHMNSVFIKSWWVDLELQFKAFISSLRSFVKDKPVKDYEKIASIEECIEDIKETYMHITQASRMFFEMSEMTRYYSGSYNNILRAYYGLIRFLISIGYDIPQNADFKQTELAFSVTFDMKPTIDSTLHLISPDIVDKRLVSFNLPYEALYNIPKYMFYLVHEVFHYITPNDRRIRNTIIFRICMDLFLRELVLCFLEDITHDSNDSRSRALSDSERRPVIKWLIDNYIDDTISKAIEDIISNDADLQRMLSKTLDYFCLELEDRFIHNNNGNLAENLLKHIMGKFINGFKRNYNTIKTEALRICEKKNESIVIHIIEKIKAFCTIEKKKRESELAGKAAKITEKFNAERLRKGFIADAQECCEGLSEAVCDLYIINLLDAPFYDYLNNLMLLFKDMSYLSVLYDDKRRDSLVFRLGLLVEFYSGDRVSSDWLQEQLNLWEKSCNDDEFNDNDKEKISACIKDCIKKFETNYAGYGDMIVRYLHSMDLDVLEKNVEKSGGTETLKQWKNRINRIRTYYREHRLSQKDAESEFNLNLKMIEFFQSQVPVHIQYKAKKKPVVAVEDVKLTAGLRNSNLKLENVVSTLAGYSEEIAHAVNRLARYDKAEKDQIGYNDAMWFRGVCNSEYNLTPSLFRNVPKGVSPHTYQVALYKEMHARVASYPNLTKVQMTSAVEQIACMQHYGVPTNFLDFSTDFVTSLHFALNPDEEKDRTNIVDAAVYVLNPHEFNKAMITMENAAWKEKKKDIDRSWYYPTNCSSIMCDAELDKYVPVNCSDEAMTDRQKIYKKATSGMKSISTELPRAIIVPQTNDRIRSQYGTFIAFSLNAKPNDKVSFKKRFDYLSIEALQEKYLREIPGAKPFCEKIVISASAIMNLRNQLASLGISQSKMYPELNNLLKTSKDAVASKFKIK